jgi:NADPH2:quinone reductase
MAMVHAGAAQYVTAQESLLMRVPPNMAWTDAAAIPVSFLTAHDALVSNAGLERGDAVLIQGVSTAVGLAAVQLARVRGASWIGGTSRSAEKLERTRQLGLDLPLVFPSEDLVDGVLNATAGRGAEVVIDHLGASVLNETLKATAIGGRVISVGRFAGVRGEIDLELLALRRIALIGVTFRTRSLPEHAAVVTAFINDHGADLESRALRPVIDRVFEFHDLPDAIGRAQRGEQFGKLVLSLP